MARILLLLFFVVALSGCAKFQYVFVDSHLYHDDDNAFVAENDTVMIKYSFEREWLPFKLFIVNKTNIPIYIDWSNSSVIINDTEDSSLFDPEYRINMINPRSAITLYSDPILYDFFKPDINDPHARVTLTGGDMKGVRFTYDENSSPLVFTNILALSVHNDLSSPAYYENSFWVSDIIKSNRGPDSYVYRPKENQTYLQKETGFTTAMKWTASIGLLLLLQVITPGI